MERRTLIILIIVLALVAGVAGCILLGPQPQVSVTGATVTSVNLSTLALSVTLTVTNPYPVSIPLKSTDYTIETKGREGPVILATGSQKGIMLNPGPTEITLPVLVSNPVIIESVISVLTTGKMEIGVSGSVTPDFFGIAPAIPFHREIITPVDTREILSGIGKEAGKMLVKTILNI